MKKILLLTGIFLLSFALVGCGTYSQSIQVDDNAYLLLIGSPDNNIVVIDDGHPINLAKDTTSFSLEGRKATKIQIPIGKHTVKITKDGVVTIHRSFFVSTGTSFELEL